MKRKDFPSLKKIPALGGFPGGASGKEPACQCRRCKRRKFSLWVRKIPWRRAWQPSPVFLPGESQGQRSLVGCCLWGRTETRLKRLSSSSSRICLQCRKFGFHPGWGRFPGEGNGNPVQFPCLGNPMDRGAWWATVPAVTRLRHDLATKPLAS